MEGRQEVWGRERGRGEKRGSGLGRKEICLLEWKKMGLRGKNVPVGKGDWVNAYQYKCEFIRCI